MSIRRLTPTPHAVALIAIFLLAGFLRVYGMNWDQGTYLHPDERFIAIVSSERIDFPSLSNIGSLFDPAHSPINPRRDGPDGKPLSFAYGTLPLYVQSVVSWAVNHVSDRNYRDYSNIYRVGRPLNVMIDLGTLLIVYLLARRMSGRSAALVAALLYATAVLPIQLSHFFTVDIWLTFFVTATLYFAIRFADRPSFGRAAALGIPVGCAFATKASVAALLLPLGLMALAAVMRATDRRLVIGYLALAGVVAVALFTVFEPYAIVRSGPFFTDISTQAEIVRGRWDVPFTRQFVGLTPGLYEARNLFLYGLGPAMVIASIVATIWAARHAWQRRDVAWGVLLFWMAAYGATLLMTEARFLRYSLPLIPVFAVFVGALLTRPTAARLRKLRATAAVVVLAGTAIWAFGFVSIYSHQNSRIAASHWMFANIPPGSTVSIETWDDGLPLPYPEAPANTFVQIPFDMYGDLAPDDKIQQIAEGLASVDYVILSSDRLADSIDNEPWRYAVQIDYYRRLAAGELGFQLVYEGKVEPGLFGLRLNDRPADESFTVYDHPHVRIYKKVDFLSAEEIHDRLLWGASQPWYPMRNAPNKTLMLGVPASETPTSNDANWNSVAISNTPFAIVVWLLAIELLGLAVAPIAATAFRASPDRGAFSARMIGLLMVGWLVWIGASLNWWPARTLVVSIITITVAACAWGWYVLRKRSGRPIELPSVRVWLAALGIWGTGFAFFLMLRAIYPDFWQTWFGGEKPFELAYLRAIARSTEFPPYDPWYSGGIINYYYYGWHLVATVTRLTGLGVSLGFQLAVATIPALLILQIVGLTTTITSSWRQRRPRPTVIIAAVTSVVAVSIIGNLDALAQIISMRGLPRTGFDFWRSTRVIDFTINEFPYFTAIWADLHPHMIDLPVIMLVLTLVSGLVLAPPRDRQTLIVIFSLLALALGTAAVTNSWDAPLCAGTILAGGIWAGARVGGRPGITIIVGAIAAIFAAWIMFLPFFSGFYSVVGDISRTATGSPLGEFLVVWGIFFLVVLVVVIADAVILGRRRTGWRDALVAGIACLAGGTAAFAFAVVRGGTVPLSAFVALWLAAGIISAGSAGAAPLRLGRVITIVSVVAAIGIGAIASHRPAAVIALSFALVAAWYAIQTRPARALPWILVGLGCLAIAGVEFVFISDDLSGGDWQRMNTVFKFYNQAWLLLGAGSALLLAHLWSRSRTLPAGDIDHRSAANKDITLVPHPRTAMRSAAVRRSACVVGAVAIVTGLLYPTFGTTARLAQDMPSSPQFLTLDGYAWMNGGTIQNATGDTIEFDGDLKAIEWLNANARGNPVILEASIGPYRGNGSRISSATGLPTVLGWDRHQRQQRYPAGIDRRMSDVHTVYNDTSLPSKLEMLRRYDVRYVIVGDVERYWNSADNPAPYASAAGLDAFNALVGNGLTVAFESGHTRVYEVTPFARLAPAPGAVHIR